MKTYINSIKICFLAIGLMLFQSCTKEGEVDQILSSTTQGAVLRTIKVNSATFNYLNTASSWSVTLEEQDAEEGKLFSEVRLYSKQVKGGVTGAEKLVKTFPASGFAVGVNGLPVGDVSVTMAQTLTALGLTTGQYTAADTFKMRLVLVLTDGREFTSTNQAASISNAFFSAPFAYSAQFSCPITDASLFQGKYRITKDGWEDYLTGVANDDNETVVYNAANGLLTFRILNLNRPYVNANTRNNSYIQGVINPTTGAVTVTSNLGLQYGGPTSTVYVVAGSGSVGSCTGDINLNLTFNGGTSYALNLIKFVP